MKVYSYIDRFERKISKSKDSPDEIFSNNGENIGIEYEYRTVEGKKSLVPCGKINRQDYISSFEDECDIVKCIQRFINGDTSVINPRQGTYGDFTNMPKTYAELFDKVQQCKNVFDTMPIEIKEKFDNSYESFWSQFGNERFDKIFNDFNNITDKPVEDITDKPVEDISVESEVKVDAE